MPSTYRADRRIRAPAAVVALIVEAGMLYALLSGLAGKVAGEVRQRFDVVSIPAQPSPTPSTPETPEPVAAAGAPKDEEGAAGRRARATRIVAPRPPVTFPSPPPVVTAPVAGSGSEATSGAAEAGSGPGAGGEGQGPGGGGAGGTGTGSGAGAGRGAQRIGGALRDADYPAAAARVRAAGTVFIRFRVGTDGRVRGCEIARSSGHAVLDERTCRLVEKRFRYRPALDAAGRPIETVETTNFTWGPRAP